MNLLNTFMIIHAFLAFITIPPYLILIKNYIIEGKRIKKEQKTLYFFLNILASGGLTVAILNVIIALSYVFQVDLLKYRTEAVIILATRALLIDIALLISSWGFAMVAKQRQ